MVKKIASALIVLSVLLLLCTSSFASENLRIEQFASVMPEIDVYFYAPSMPEASSVKLGIGQREIIANEVVKQDENEIAHHYFLVDVSTSTTSAQIEAIKQSINEFVQNKRAQDTVTLITFGVEVSVLLERETSADAIINAAQSMQANEAGTLFFDAIATVSRLAKQEEIALQRKLLYVFSDSVDYNVGGYTAQEAQNLLLDANLPLYAFGFDNGSKENLDNFGALARTTGGAIRIVNASDLPVQFSQNTEYLNGEVYIAKFDTQSNILPQSSQEIIFSVSDEIVSYMPTFHFFVPDDIAPQILQASQSGDNTIELSFSEPVSGANNRDNYIVLDESGTPVGIEAAAYNEQTLTVLLTLNNAQSGSLSISSETIVDLSIEQNNLSNAVQVNFEAAGAVVAQSSITGANGQSGGAPIGAYIFLVALVIAIASVIIIVNVKKRSAQQAVVEQAATNNVPPVAQTLNSGETGKAHFMHQSNKNIILEVANTAGAGKRVTLPIAKTMFIGRSDICDVVFDDLKMSRQHCVIEENDGVYNITNLSPGGTLLNGVPINTKRPLNHGDKIEAGNHTIVFIIPR